jgi:two-component system, OmpR family, response regulator
MKNQKYRKKIFVADDEEGIRNGISDFLTNCGYEVVTFSNGQLLLEGIVTQKKPPDLVLLDIMMEGLDGIRTAREIRREEKNKSKTVFLTPWKSR